MQVWRICRGRYAEAAFSGEGARLYGARWNRPGVAMVYTSPSRALAAMEFFVNMDPTEHAEGLVMCSAEVPNGEGLWTRLDLRNLSDDWRDLENPEMKAHRDGVDCERKITRAGSSVSRS